MTATCILIVIGTLFVAFRLLAQELGYQPRPLPLQFRANLNGHGHGHGIRPGIPPTNSSLLTVFLIDGLRADIFYQELQAGHLPNMQRFASQGCSVKNVMSTFPSITGYAYWPLLTGLDATRSGHLGTRYFDRRYNRTKGNWRNHYGPASINFEPNFEPSVPTLFEAQAQMSFKSDEQEWTFAGNSMLKRGANWTYVASQEQYFTKIGHKWWLARWIRHVPILKWIAPDFYAYERRYLRRILNILQVGKPRIAWIVFASTDNAAHAFGVHDQYRQVLRAIDDAIGQYVQAVSSHTSGVGYDKHSFAIISDHGEASVDIPAGGNLDLRQAFQAKGVRAWRGNAKHWSATFDEPLETFGADKDLLIGIQGDASGLIYVKSKQGWLHRTLEDELRCYSSSSEAANGGHGSDKNGSDRDCVDLVQTALEIKGVELIAWSRENGIVAVQTKITKDNATDTLSAVGVIKLEKDGRISYIVETNNNVDVDDGGGECPLGYARALSDGSPRTAREWLQATSTPNTPFPYAIVRLIQSLTVPGLAPDIIVTTQEGFDLSKEWEYFIISFAGGHGGINRNHSTTPAIFFGDGVSGEGDTVNVATSEDIGASLHAMLLGQQQPMQMDFLRERTDGDIIAKAFYENDDKNRYGVNGENAAEALLRGRPVSCIR